MLCYAMHFHAVHFHFRLAWPAEREREREKKRKEKKRKMASFFFSSPPGLLYLVLLIVYTQKGLAVG